MLALVAKFAHRVDDRFELDRRKGIAREWLEVAEVIENDLQWLLPAPCSVDALVGNRAMELDQAVSNSVDYGRVDLPSFQHAIEHPIHGQTPHQCSILNGLAISINAHSSIVGGYASNAEIDAM